MNRDLTIVGLIFILLIQMSVHYKDNLEKHKVYMQLFETIDVVYYVSDKLDIALENIDSLNKEQEIMQKELNDRDNLKRLTKELR